MLYIKIDTTKDRIPKHGAQQMNNSVHTKPAAQAVFGKEVRFTERFAVGTEKRPSVHAGPL